MSWLARSIANSLKLDDDEDDNHSPNSKTDASAPKSESDNVQDQFTAQNPRGVKEDLSELTKSFSRQLWGVASFLAPPPLEREVTIPDQKQPSDETDQLSDPEISDEALIEGIKSDFAEISGKFKSGITKLSSHAAVSEITKMASSFLQFGSELESTDALGVTEEVLLFVRTIATHPETWLEFPVPNNEEFDDFDMSDVQQEHALVVESLAPTLAALRMELCPGYMSEGCFWKIYFVLLHPRLTKHDAELLSTPQIVEARAMLACKLENRAKTMPESAHPGTATSYLNEAAELPREETLSAPSGAEPSESSSLKTLAAEAPVSNVAAELETDKHAVESTETKVVDKPVVKEEPLNAIKNQPSLSGSSAKASDEAIRNQPSLSGSSAKDSDKKFEDDGDDWLKEESEIVVSKSGSTMHLENDEDVSFSDLEEEDDDVPVTYKKATSGSDSSTKDSREWVQLSRSSADSAKDIKPVSSQSVGSQQVSARNPETKESSDWLDFDDIVEM